MAEQKYIEVCTCGYVCKDATDREVHMQTHYASYRCTLRERMNAELMRTCGTHHKGIVSMLTR